MDLRLPVFDGLEATKRLRQALPSVQVLMLSVQQSPGCVARAHQAGAAGWISKDSSPSKLILALEKLTDHCAVPTSA
jgi:DNA-binding NarL/FixJ family response regulator